jgi:hypothetical protein
MPHNEEYQVPFASLSSVFIGYSFQSQILDLVDNVQSNFWNFDYYWFPKYFVSNMKIMYIWISFQISFRIGDHIW